MYVLFFVLDKTERLDDVLETFLECGIRGATIMNSTGMARILSSSVPLFASLRSLFEDDRKFNYTIFAVLEDETKVDRLAERIQDIIGDLNEPGTGMMFTVPVGRVIGLKRGKMECD